MNVTIWHRATCSKSRGALELLLEAGLQPKVVDYVNTPPSKTQLQQAIAAAGITVREALRDNEAEYKTLGLNDPALPDDTLLDAMLANPKLINRPFVFTDKGVRLCRPPERVFEIL